MLGAAFVIGAFLLASAPSALPIGTCVETTDALTTDPDEVRARACAVLGEAPSCPAEAVESFEASARARRLWVLPVSTEAGRRAWAKLPSQSRPPAPVTAEAEVDLRPGDVVGEDALVPAPDRKVPCGPLRPRWVDAAPRVEWRDAVLEVGVRVDIEAERQAQLEREQARRRVDEARSDLPARGRTPRVRVFIQSDGTRLSRWVDDEGEDAFFPDAPKPELAADLLRAGFRRADTPEPLPPVQEQLLALNPVLERLLRSRGRLSARPETIAGYRLEGTPHRFVLVRTDYTEILLELQEPLRSRVRAALRVPEDLSPRLGAAPSTAGRATKAKGPQGE